MSQQPEDLIGEPGLLHKPIDKILNEPTPMPTPRQPSGESPKEITNYIRSTAEALTDAKATRDKKVEEWNVHVEAREKSLLGYVRRYVRSLPTANEGTYVAKLHSLAAKLPMHSEAYRALLQHINNPQERIRTALGTLVATRGEHSTDNVKQELRKKKGQMFFTPPDVAELLVRYADVLGHTVLEPSAGHGALVEACETWGAIWCDCVESDAENAAVLTDKWPDTTCVHIADFLSLGQADLLREFGQASYSRIVMNPPFTKQQDVKHVNHALTFLADEGVLTAIVSGVHLNGTSRAAEEWRAKYPYVEFEPLPKESFKSSGTLVNTCMVQIKKP